MGTDGHEVTLCTTATARPSLGPLFIWARRNKTIVGGTLILLALLGVAILAPWLAGDPLQFEPINRLKRPSEEFWFGTDQFGRDVYSRVVYGTRISLVVGFSVAVLATGSGWCWECCAATTGEWTRSSCASWTA